MARLRFIGQNICPVFDLARRSLAEAECELLGEMMAMTPVPENETVTDDASGWKTGSGNGFDDVAGMDALKEKLSDSVLWPITNRGIAEEYRIAPPNWMLLYGPPGCGKTYFAEKFAEQAGCSYRVLLPSDLGSIFVHGSQGMIAKVFEEAEKHAPCVLCIDEIDAVLPVRSDSPSALCRNDEVNEFLAHMNNCGSRGIFVVGTTNKKDLIDPAALRSGRLDIQEEIPVPDRTQRKALYDIHLKSRPLSKDIDTDRLAGLTGGFVASDIAGMVNAAALRCAKERTPITQDSLEEAVRNHVPSSERRNARPIGFSLEGIRPLP